MKNKNGELTMYELDEKKIKEINEFSKIHGIKLYNTLMIQFDDGSIENYFKVLATLNVAIMAFIINNVKHEKIPEYFDIFVTDMRRNIGVTLENMTKEKENPG